MNQRDQEETTGLNILQEVRASKCRIFFQLPSRINPIPERKVSKIGKIAFHFLSENYYVVKVTPEGLKSWRFLRPFESTDEGSLPVTKFCEVLEEAATEGRDIDVVEMLKLARDRLCKLAIPYQGIAKIATNSILCGIKDQL